MTDDMSDIYEAIRQMAAQTEVADVGMVEKVDAEGGRCDVNVYGKSPVAGAWLRCGSEEGGLVVVPEVGSEVVVVWINTVTAVVVAVEKAARIEMRGGENGGLVNIEELKKWMRNVEADLATLRTLLSTTVVVGNGAPLGAVFSPQTVSVESKIEDKNVKH